MQAGGNDLEPALAECPAMLWDFVAAEYGSTAVGEAWEEFTLWSQEAGRFSSRSPYAQSFSSWFFHCWVPGADDTSVGDRTLRNRCPTAVFLERHARRLQPLLRRYLEGCVGVPFSFHQVLRVDGGDCIVARDILGRRRWRLRARPADQNITRGTILFGQVVDVADVGQRAVWAPGVIAASHKEDIIGLRYQITSGTHRRSPPEVLRKWDIELRELYWWITREVFGIARAS